MPSGVVAGEGLTIAAWWPGGAMAAPLWPGRGRLQCRGGWGGGHGSDVLASEGATVVAAAWWWQGRGGGSVVASW